jgi:SAM-dependent methyltransferase
MHIKLFQINSYNKHYEGAYAEREMDWRRLCAVDKINNLQVLLGENSVDAVLEVGCGTGALLTEVSRRGIGKKHVGVDLADPNEHADPNAQELNLIKIDGKRLPFDDGSFDLVYASHVVEHVPDPRGLITEMLRVSKKFIYIEVPCEMHIRTNQKALQKTVNIGHINSYSPETFLLLLQSSGLNVKDIKIFDHSLKVHQFHTSPNKGLIKKLIRGAMLRFSPILASRLFTYHCGAFGRVGTP